MSQDRIGFQDFEYVHLQRVVTTVVAKRGLEKCKKGFSTRCQRKQVILEAFSNLMRTTQVRVGGSPKSLGLPIYLGCCVSIVPMVGRRRKRVRRGYSHIHETSADQYAKVREREQDLVVMAATLPVFGKAARKDGYYIIIA